MTQKPTTGTEIYNPFVLAIYDFYVLTFSNRVAWECPTSKMLEFYNQHVSANHLDVGVGTGYYLDNCTFPVSNPRIALLDLNMNSLKATASRLEHYSPTIHQANVLELIDLKVDKFDSIGMNYLLHCVPGTLASKSQIFANLKPYLNEGGVLFGTTILGAGITHNALGRFLMNTYNQRGIFSNAHDNLADLESGLADNFAHYTTDIIGKVALFSAHN